MSEETRTFNRELFWRLLALARPELKTLIIALVFLALGSAMSLLYPQAVRAIVDQALGNKNMDLVNQWSLVILVVSVLQAIAVSVRFFLFSLAGERTVLRLREQLYKHVLDQEISFFDFNKTGELMSRLSADCAVLQNAVSVNISMGLRNLVGALGGLVLLILTSYKLAGIVLLVVPPMALSAGIYGRRIRGFSKRAQDALADASVVAEETLSGIRTVRAFAQENYEQERYSRALMKSLVQVRLRIRQVSWFMGIASAFGFAAVAGVLWYGGHLVVSGEMTVGDLTQFLLYLMVVAFSVAALGGLWGDFQSAIGAARRVFEILDRKPEVDNQMGRRPEDIRGQITFDHVSFAYPTRPDLPVLRDVSLSIESGHSVALVGSSGSGKTTIANLLIRLYDPQAGEIRLDGYPIRNIQPDWLRHQIGVVSQEPILISATIEENIRYGHPHAKPDEIRQAARIANAHEFIERFPNGYQTLVGERGIQLSGGQKQRVAIARAVLKDPTLLILDEATSALDTESEQLVQEALNRLMKGRTTLIIAHRLATIRGADSIFVMDQGTIVESGTHEELVRKTDGHYLKLINRQFTLGILR